MYNQATHKARLEQHAESMLFEAEFKSEVEKQIALKAASKDKSLVERLGIKAEVDRDQRFKIQGDDEHRTLTWKAFMKDCAFYYDVPSMDDENKMKKTLQRKYDDLLPVGWRAPLTTRRDLLTWACSQLNNSFSEKGFPSEELLPCDNYRLLVKMFGPDYEILKPKMGHIRGLFD
jgi:hypothetical protein